MNKKKSLIPFLCFYFALAIAFGAMGAHALKNRIDEKAMHTFQTGVQYHLVMALALLIISIYNEIQNKMLRSYILVGTIGSILFSLNCYLYAVSQIPYYAHIVPVGGILMISSFLGISWKLLKDNFEEK